MVLKVPDPKKVECIPLQHICHYQLNLNDSYDYAFYFLRSTSLFNSSISTERSVLSPNKYLEK